MNLKLSLHGYLSLLVKIHYFSNYVFQQICLTELPQKVTQGCYEYVKSECLEGILSSLLLMQLKC